MSGESKGSCQQLVSKHIFCWVLAKLKIVQRRFAIKNSRTQAFWIDRFLKTWRIKGIIKNKNLNKNKRRWVCIHKRPRRRWKKCNPVRNRIEKIKNPEIQKNKVKRRRKEILQINKEKLWLNHFMNQIYDIQNEIPLIMNEDKILEKIRKENEFMAIHSVFLLRDYERK